VEKVRSVIARGWREERRDEEARHSELLGQLNDFVGYYNGSAYPIFV
jgi:hypothetical protein